MQPKIIVEKKGGVGEGTGLESSNRMVTYKYE